MEGAGAPRMYMRAPPARCPPGSLALANEGRSHCIKRVDAGEVPDRTTGRLQGETGLQGTGNEPRALFDRQVGAGTNQLLPDSSDGRSHAAHARIGSRPRNEGPMRRRMRVLRASHEIPTIGKGGALRPHLPDDFQQMDAMGRDFISAHPIDDTQSFAEGQIPPPNHGGEHPHGLVDIADHRNGLPVDHDLPLGHAPEGVQGVDRPLAETGTEGPHGFSPFPALRQMKCKKEKYN